MKRTTYSLLIALLFAACANHNKDLEFKQKVFSAIWGYSKKETLVLDSVIIHEIDTLTPKKLLQQKIAYYKAKVLWPEGYEKQINELTRNQYYLDTITKLVKTADSTTFLNYIVMFKAKYSDTHNVESETNIETVLLTPGFKIKRMEDYYNEDKMNYYAVDSAVSHVE